VQGNEIAALHPSQKADKVLTRSSKPVVQDQKSDADVATSAAVTRSSSADSKDSDPMDFDNEVLETLAHLDHATTPPTIVKFSPILPSSASSPPATCVNFSYSWTSRLANLPSMLTLSRFSHSAGIQKNTKPR